MKSRQLALGGIRTLSLAALLGACGGDIDEMGGVGGDGNPTGGQGPGSGGGNGNVTGTGGTTGPGSGPVGSASFTCDPSKQPASDGWRRLSLIEYRNTMQDLLTFGLGSASVATSVMGAAPIADLPDELSGNLKGDFSRGSQDVSQNQLQGWYNVARATGAAIATPERVGILLGSCATDAATDNDATCLAGFVRRFGERAFRRPLSEEEVTFYQGFYGATPGVGPTGVGDVVSGLLMAPPFLLMTEHGDTAVPGKNKVYSLTAFEIASRLSYQFWETMPDQQLWDAAKSGALKTTAGYAKELDRIFADPRTRKNMRTFFKQWLRASEVPQLTTSNDDPVFKSFAGSDIPKAPLRDSMIQEVLDMADYLVWDKGGSASDLLTSNLVFPKSPELAKLYGVSQWQSGEPPQVQGGVRPGILTRAAFLASGTANSRPISRGVFIRTGLLCDTIPPPPGGNAPPVPDLSPTETTRQTVEGLTEAAGTSCAACHKAYINPLGFALENFDGLGRYRTEQRLFDRVGKQIGKAPIDSATIPKVNSTDTRPSRGLADLSQFIVESGKMPACLARNYYHYTYARREDPAADGCALEQSRKAFAKAEGGSLKLALRDVALGSEFTERAF
jgi:hypothetical protein